MEYNMKSMQTALLFFYFSMLFMACGCVHRSLTITTKPETSCEVFIDGKHKGKTPYSEKFVYYGKHEIMLKTAAGAVTVTDISLVRPWFEYFPVDLFSEFFLPVSIDSTFAFAIPLRKEQKVDFDAIEKRAAEYKEEFKKLRKSDEDR